MSAISDVSDPVSAAIAAALRPLLSAHSAGRSSPQALRVAVALSGGRDSMVLLDALARFAAAERIVVSALHVHHGISPNADAWAAFCTAECARRNIPLAVARVSVVRTPGQSLEAAARTARYAAFAIVDADVIALAHHADDQAETLLLQLLRGAGPQGLGAMPALRAAGTAPAMLRPLLELPRSAIEAMAAAFAIHWIDDESNADTRFKRNYLRHEVAPRLASAFPGFPATLARAAGHQAEAAGLLDDLAAIDARESAADDPQLGLVLDRRALAALPLPRARNLLRWFLRRHGLAAASAARLAAMLAQLTGAAPGARVRLVHAGAEIGVHRERVVVHTPPVAPFAVTWNGESNLALPHGVLEWAKVVGAGIAADSLAEAPVIVRSRKGGERFQLSANQPRQALKGLLQSAGMPTWDRAALPLVFCGDAFAGAPGIGTDLRFQAAGSTPGYLLRWHPRWPQGAGRND